MRGSPEQTRELVDGLLARFADDAVLWVGEEHDAGRFMPVGPRALASVLGRSFDAVVLDAHAGIDADRLGIVQGLAWGGGVIALRMPPRGAAPSVEFQRPLAAFPYWPKDVTSRFGRHVEATIDAAQVPVFCPGAQGFETPPPLSPPKHATTGHEEQRQVVETLRKLWSRPGPSRTVLMASRGRGKSSALGLALQSIVEEQRPHSVPRTAIVTAAHPDAVAEVLRFALPLAPPPDDPDRLRFVPLAELSLHEGPLADIVVIDEAAQISVPLLRRLVAAHPNAHLAFATTTHGYEGTGRGFALRFCPWLQAQSIPVTWLTMRAPIRWDEGDPVERLVFDALLLDAEPADIEAPMRASVQAPPEELLHFDRDALVADPTALRELFGLLVHAHYRTTPRDLHRLLDAPNLDVHGVREHGKIVAATIVAREGGLPEALVDDMFHGRTRIAAHALPDALVAHLGKREAGGLSMIRSVRIATHPKCRRRGLASRLVEHVHRAYDPDLFGTVFGATPAVIAFREALGYRLVRVSASRGARTGEPSVLMLRSNSVSGYMLARDLQAELGRDLRRQLMLLEADGDAPLHSELRAALLRDLRPPALLTADDALALTRNYAHGPRTFESVAVAVRRLVQLHPDALAEIEPRDRQLIEGRVLEGHGWRQVTREAGQPTVPAAMRALRRAVRSLLDAIAL